MLSNIKIEQGNSNYNPDKCRNGGGYDQPIITAEADGMELVINDSSCGDFGSRIYVQYGSKTASYGTMEGVQTWSDFTKMEKIDVSIINDIWDQLGYCVPYKEELEELE